jgi:hypothetical protein
VIGVATWTLTRAGGEKDTGIVPVDDPAEAAAVALRLASSPGE